MNDSFLSLLDGLLLGDGSLGLTGLSKNANYRQTCKSVDYLQYIQHLFETHGFSFGKSLYYRGDQFDSWLLTSKVHSYLTEQESRWYVKRKKIVPLDVRIDPTSVSHWYIGDGTLSGVHNYLCGIKLATNCFTKDECDFLAKRLQEAIGLTKRPRVTEDRTNQYVIWIVKSGVQQFLKFCGDCPCPFYSYKWDLDCFWRTSRLRGEALRVYKEMKKLTISSEAPTG